MHSESQSVSLPGGGVGGAVRVGETVHRPAGPWSTAVHALLDHLHRRGLDGVPRAFGFEMRDGRPTEVLSYLPGDCAEAYDPWPDWAFSEQLLVQVMAWTRRFHDAVRDFRPAEPLRWRAGTRALGPDEIICHHDIAPYNVIVDPTAGSDPASFPASDGAVRLVGVIDWDVAGPGKPVEDLAFAAWNFVPLHGAELPPAREIANRLSLMVATYGDYTPAQLLDAVGPRLQRSVSVIRGRAAAGDAGMRNLVDAGRVDAVERLLHRWDTVTDQVRAAL